MATITELANAIDGFLDNTADRAQILVLQNNPPNQINMALPAGFVLPEFHEFDNKNWELQNVLDNSDIGANIGAIRGLLEDWSTAGGWPTNAVPVVVNAGGGVPVILAGIRAGQKLFQIKKYYPTANRYVRMLEIGSLKQGAHESVASFWAKIQKYGDQLGYTDAQKKTYFLSGVRENIREEVYRIGQHRPINDILDNLAELELRQGVLGLPPSYLNYIPTPPINSNIAPQQQGISLADIQKIFQDAQVQQKTENQALIKKITELESQMAQQAQVPTPQTVEPVRQPKGPPSSLKTEEGLKNYYVAEYLKEVGLLNKEDLDSDYPVKPFQRPCPQRSNNSARFDRIEEGLDETRDASYFKPLTPINFQNTPPGSDNEGDGYDEENNIWTGYDPPPKKNSQPEMYDQLLSKLSPPIRKMCLSRKAQEEESKESDEWLSSLQYLNANINDLTISKSFLDPGSEFGDINNPAIEALGWKADKPSNFAIKGNFKHITDSLGWYTDVPVTLKDKENKTVTVIGNFVHIDNGETEPMLFFGMSNIRKLQGVPEPNKNQFRIKLHGKAYIIPTFSKALVVKDSLKKDQDQASTNTSSPTSEEDLKKSVKNLKSD
ncbi:hypothetical protein GLOIN_2v1778046 [Rhizophagus clarus]|uniref:Uncharacterized protein n=1 Tax=Rhizophagus clarus TaxID=94130 RepID=A0A8H3R5P8_9GLOM|nr:hypothetical protein GLOIN_2v1778046 [Rhizophagus clarus]